VVVVVVVLVVVVFCGGDGDQVWMMPFVWEKRFRIVIVMVY